MKRTIRVDQQISLKALVPSDAMTIYKITDQQRDYLGEWLPFVQFTNCVQDTREFVEIAIEDRELNKDFVYKICLEGRLIGLIGTKRTDYLNKNTELGYWLSQSHQQKGVMTRSLVSLLSHLFQECRLERVEICCASKNRKSIAVAERLGFTLEGVKRNGEWVGENTYRDLKVFSLLQSEYQTLHKHHSFKNTQ